jgi:hypothetical protein
MSSGKAKYVAAPARTNAADRGDLDRPTLSARRLPQRRLELLFGSAGAHDSHRARQAIEARGYLDGRVCETTLVSESWPHG